ncbi:DUF5958 family protein [Streptomyces sp. NPDC006638]|uniref:DUF5958 family protein n=1 Tax=Streptomyces sp. NPDC006638 TaxID=3157183 RepID=UPI0033A93E0D
MSQGIEWFEALGPAEQTETLRHLCHHCVQARAVTEDATAPTDAATGGTTCPSPTDEGFEHPTHTRSSPYRPQDGLVP